MPVKAWSFAYFFNWNGIKLPKGTYINKWGFQSTLCALIYFIIASRTYLGLSDMDEPEEKASWVSGKECLLSRRD